MGQPERVQGGLHQAGLRKTDLARNTRHNARGVTTHLRLAVCATLIACAHSPAHEAPREPTPAASSRPQGANPIPKAPLTLPSGEYQGLYTVSTDEERFVPCAV